MLRLNYSDLKNKAAWREKNIKTPEFNPEEVRENTLNNPKWVHFGAGNIFRAFVASCQDELLNDKLSDTGIIAVETYDEELLDKIYQPHNNLALVTTLKETGEIDNKVVGSIVESLKGTKDFKLLVSIFENPGLQMVSFTITEKGYAVKDNEGKYYGIIESDIEDNCVHPKHIMSMITCLLYHRYKNGSLPITLVSMDNCSHNGDKLKASILEIAKSLSEKDAVEKGFIDYLGDNNKVAFTLSMIDKITPRPSEDIGNNLKKLGFVDTEIIVTDKNTYMAPFVNAEETQYLVIEDTFPNGRPALEKSTGVIFTDRDTVNKVETMKVTTCLNPLHTALAIFGCILDHKTIADEMKDTELSALVKCMAYEEGIKAVVDPKIISPIDFVDEVINKRFSNPYIVDTPQRIATDTSQKLGIRFGETIKSYERRQDLDTKDLKYIPLVIAGWLRYLNGIDDFGKRFTLSPDPMMDELMDNIENIETLLSNKNIFGVNLYDVGLGHRIEDMYHEMMQGNGAVRNTIKKYLGHNK